MQGFNEILDKWMNIAENEGSSTAIHFWTFINEMPKLSEAMLLHSEFLKLKQEQFDLLIIGWFANDFQIGLGEHFKCPVIISFPFKPSIFVRNYVGNPHGISHIPSAALAHKGSMNFQQRIMNFLAITIETAMSYAIDYMVLDPIYRRHFPSDRYPSMFELRKNVSLVLVNHHFSEGSIEAYLPAIIEVGGMHINSKINPLPKVCKLLTII